MRVISYHPLHLRWSTRDWLLLFTALLLAAFIYGIGRQAVVVPDSLYDAKLSAARSMEQCMEAVRMQKEALGLEIDPMDYHKTGMLGQDYSPITTTLGAPEAKRTSSHPDMAALVLDLLVRAGVGPGDRVGAVFSGSFPSLNLAVLAACQELKADCYFIASIGSSTYGANQPEFTFPDMVAYLMENGLVNGHCLAVTPGGDQDVGLEMDPQVLDGILRRMEEYGFPVMLQPDYSANLKMRMELLEEGGPLDCFVNVGGNLTSMGRGDSAYYLGQGLLASKPAVICQNSGLIERYCAKGVPVINLLNLKKLTAEYGLPYDPSTPPIPGTTAIYYQLQYNYLLCYIALILAVGLLLVYRLWGKREKQKLLQQWFHPSCGG
ncbi:MAG TPA: poly-gamma-glutamate system protein [Clostridiales bacterium]|nr:poly-gamma-glutamate system protein [Clostridiales bacterium]